ncbi:serine/threonine protein phosphatase [Leptospira ognonensis]|uniref:Serine/threonine protein phosphatase n=1 Tax=Leptospira ognonensis TaxID=2484945 RepID=A0A4R9K2H9_9LEPT|nr:SpoIIE family protein phosphatase [Leptospira ognonensis]TGL59336.1 serine/threonine protein phosphatase [Leptospira ognonensis]
MKDFYTPRALLATFFLPIGYVICSKIGFQLAFLNSQVSPVWPPEGMALTALLLLGRAAIPGIFLGAFLANYLNNPHIPTALLIGIGNTLSSSLNFYFLLRITGNKDPLYSVRGLIYFITICSISGSALSASIGVTSLLYWDFLPSEAYWNVLFTWFSGEMQGFLIVAPLLFVWLNPDEKMGVRWFKKIELMLWCLMIYISGRIAFSDELPLLFLPIPFVILTSLRFRQYGATLASVILSFTAVTQTIHGMGVFAMKRSGNLSINDSLIYLDAFLFSINGIAYFLVAVSRERERAKQDAVESLEVLNRLKEIANEELEKKVFERTKVIEAQKLEIDKQLDVAKRIQESLFPNKEINPEPFEVCFRNVPMMKVGGDLFDIHWNPDTKELGAFICDVSGHGIPAAFLSALVKMSLDFWVRSPYLLTQSIEHIRNQITPNLKDHFVTASFIHIDTNTGKIKFARAGHFPLYIIKSSGELVTINPSGRAITAYFPTNSSESFYQLSPGDLIVLLTDGLTEASIPGEIQLYGEEQLLDLITINRMRPLTEIRDIVFDIILKYSGGEEMIQDDLTLALIRFKSNQ